MKKKDLKGRIDGIAEYSLIPWRKSIATILKDFFDISEKEYTSLQDKISDIEAKIQQIEKRRSDIENSLRHLSER